MFFWARLVNKVCNMCVYRLYNVTMVTTLQDLNPGEVFAPGAIFLSVVTYVGTAVSILCLLITVVTYSASK